MPSRDHEWDRYLVLATIFAMSGNIMTGRSLVCVLISRSKNQTAKDGDWAKNGLGMTHAVYTNACAPRWRRTTCSCDDGGGQFAISAPFFRVRVMWKGVQLNRCRLEAPANQVLSSHNGPICPPIATTVLLCCAGKRLDVGAL